MTPTNRSTPACLQTSGTGIGTGNLRLVDAAVVEDKVDAGELFSRLLGFQVELHHPFVTCPTQGQIHALEIQK